VDRAVVTHGHADHARQGHKQVAATAQTLALMAARYGDAFAGETLALSYGETLTRDGVDIRLTPAGHVLGSAQVTVTWRGLKITVSGDFKRAADPTCAPFEPAPSDIYVTEATFGLPVFRHPSTRAEVDKLLASLRQFPERTHLVGAYSLGKAQRIIALLRQAGYDAPIFVHGALTAVNAVYQRFGVDLGPLAPATLKDRRGPAADFAGEIVVAPPSAFHTPWAQRFADPVLAFASGWMRVRARARRQGVELPLVISDHADWDELTDTVREINPAELWVTHGREEALVRWCALNSIAARPLSLIGYGEGDGDPE
jgi:putative mRNA 3-end processing factor